MNLCLMMFIVLHQIFPHLSLFRMVVVQWLVFRLALRSTELQSVSWSHFKNMGSFFSFGLDLLNSVILY